MGKRKVTYWVADTESTVPPDTLAYGDETQVHSIQIPEETRVWCTSLTCVDQPGVYVDDSIDAFVNRLFAIDGDMVIYFHNLTWDAYFLMAWLANAGYTFRDNRTVDDEHRWNVARGEVVTLASGTGTFYSLKFRLANKLVEVRDSLKLLPFSVDMIGRSFGTEHQKLKGTVDYGKERPEGYVMTEEERRYAENDVLVVAEALKMLDDITPEWRECLTIGSMCMREYLHTFRGNDRKTRHDSYRLRFPELDKDTDMSLRKGYFGGWCYVNPLVQDRILGAGHVYDVNSLYPYAMHGRVFPCGEPHESDRPFADVLRSDTPFFVRFEASFTLKEGCFPFLQEGRHIFGESTHISDCPQGMELTLSRPDFELFEECYDIDTMDVLEVWTFDGVSKPFDAYIDKWYNTKQQAGRDGNKALRQFAKLMLNNLYGKFAQSPVGHAKNFDVEDGYVVSTDYMDERTGGYIPVGAYITAYARGVTVRAANANHESFCYSDTDSIHLSAPAKGIDVDPYRLGAWDNESDYTAARFVRQKTYIEIDANSGEADVKAAGCPAECKLRMSYKVTHVNAEGHNVFEPLDYDDEGHIISPRRSTCEMLERFTYGLTETGKKRRVRVKGGVVLVPTTFRISKVGVRHGG
jgi:hypothetical protein